MGMTCYNFVWTYNCIQLDISGGLSLLITFLISGYFYPLIALLIRLQLVSVLFPPMQKLTKHGAQKCAYCPLAPCFANIIPQLIQS